MRDTRAVWSDDNSRGLLHGEAGEWSQATDAFAAAADAISAEQASGGSMGSGSHDALALVLGNLAGASFRAGRSDDAIRHAQRACALRVALVGEDAVAVARARSDLAVMLCTVGRTAEAYALLERAIAGIEQQAGDDDARLVPVLENAARVAIAMARPDNAEPHLLRLHALLAAHELPTTSADVLLSKVAAARHVGSEEWRAPVESSDAPIAAHVVRATNEAEDDDGFTLVDADDQPLRDTLALSDIPLRTTPRGVRAIANMDELAPIERLDAEDGVSAGTAAADGTREALEGMRARADSATADAMPEDLEVVATFSPEIERGLHATLPTSKLGFTVEYGFDGYEDTRRGSTDASSNEVPRDGKAFYPSPVPAFETAAFEAITVAVPAFEATAVVIEAPTATDAVSNGGTAETATAFGDDDDDDADTARRRPFGTALRAGRATAPQSSHGVLVAAAITLSAAATAAWAYLRAAG